MFHLMQKIVFQGTKVRVRPASPQRTRPGRGAQTEAPLVSEALQPIANIGEVSTSLTENSDGIPERK